MESLERIELVLPLPPNPNSSRWRKAGWVVRYRDKKQYFANAYARMMEQDVRFPREPWARARVDCLFRVWNLLDEYDNLPVRMKAILDFLTCDRHKLIPGRKPSPKKTAAIAGTGFVVDDSPRYLERGTVDQTLDRSKETGRTVELIIWRIA